MDGKYNDRIQKERAVNGLLKKCLLGFMDAVTVTVALFATCYITNGSLFDSVYSSVLFRYDHLFLVIGVVIVINYALGLYRSVWNFAGSDEVLRGTCASVLDTVAIFFVDRVLYYDVLKIYGRLAFYSYIVLFILIALTTIGPRMAYRVVRRMGYNVVGRYSGKNRENSRIMIVGAGFMGNFVLEALANEKYRKGRPVIAVDDNPAKLHKTIGGVKIVGNCEQIPFLAEKYNIDKIIICIPSATKIRQKEIIDLAMQTKAEVKISPGVEDMFEQGGNRRVRDVDVADLLCRPEIKLDKKVCRYLIGKRILVTGGGGSIGAELCKQVARYSPESITIFDIYENCAFELQNDLQSRYGDDIVVNVRIGNICEMERLREVFAQVKPDVVFHAAAHKHVPLMEDSPCEAVRNNVFGTYNVARVCDEFCVKRMVTISTDKAVNPTNVMGCTKRITEVIVQYMNSVSDNTEYTAVRFGNVLGSHGSVIPLFKKQIENGGPVKVTHPDITRYFMTIPEAAQLVCQAGGLAKGGEVFVLDMGQPVKIMDLAKNLIRLSGFTEEEIPIEITGLRPGEKMYEELAMDSEVATRQRTANEKIFVTQPMNISTEDFERMIKSLEDIDDGNVRDKLMAIVPDYHPASN